MPVLSPAPPMDPFPGARFVPLAAPSRGSVRTSVWQIEIAPGTPSRPHQVTEEEIFVVLDGEASVTIAGDVSRAAKGDAIVVPPNTDFAVRTSGPGPLRMLCVFPVGGKACTPDGAVFTPPWAE